MLAPTEMLAPTGLLLVTVTGIMVFKITDTAPSLERSKNNESRSSSFRLACISSHLRSVVVDWEEIESHAVIIMQTPMRKTGDTEAGNVPQKVDPGYISVSQFTQHNVWCVYLLYVVP
jgi:hypothetical protein